MSTSTRPAPAASLDLNPPRRSLFDWAFAALVVLAAAWGWHTYGAAMDVYERAILIGTVPSLVALGWFWRPVQGLTVAVGLATVAAAALYLRVTDDHGADLARGEEVFWLKYFLSSQSAILWMSVLFFMSTLFYWIGLLSKGATGIRLGSRLAWAGVFMALTGTLVRWFESHQIAPDIGHIPVSNLYEVFVLFAWLTTAYWLYYEDRFAKMGQALGSLGAFVMLVVSAAVGFLLWYALVRGAHEIQPLVPALQSWWMKLHVPANFIGYVSLAISKRNVEGGRLEKVVGLAQSYRAFLVLHIKATKSQMHTRIRGRSSTWLQVLNRAVPEKLNAEKKTITGRTFKR